MSGLVNKILVNLIEEPLDAIGLLHSRTLRFAVFSAVAAGALFYFKPSGLFDAEGNIIPSEILQWNKQEGAKIKTVPLNVYMVSGIFGLGSVYLL